jgi:hypothetical protein
VHDSCRGKGAFDGAIRGIRTLQRHGIFVAARVTIHRNNVHDLENVARFLLEDLGLPDFGNNVAGYLGACCANAQDVLLTIDGQPIENDGTIEFRPGERTFFGYPMQLKLLSETIGMELLRNGERRRVRIPLTRAIDSSRLVPNLHYDIPPEYYLIGGLLFEPLTLDYLGEYAPPAELLHLYLNGEPTEARRRVIVLTKVLADELNIGYHDFQDAVIQRVNGQNISTLPDLIAAFENNSGTYHVVEDIRGYRLVLDREKVATRNTALLRRYDITRDRHLNGSAPAGD